MENDYGRKRVFTYIRQLSDVEIDKIVHRAYQDSMQAEIEARRYFEERRPRSQLV